MSIQIILFDLSLFFCRLTLVFRVPVVLLLLLWFCFRHCVCFCFAFAFCVYHLFFSLVFCLQFHFTVLHFTHIAKQYSCTHTHANFSMYSQDYLATIVFVRSSPQLLVYAAAYMCYLKRLTTTVITKDTQMNGKEERKKRE